MPAESRPAEFPRAFFVAAGPGEIFVATRTRESCNPDAGVCGLLCLFVALLLLDEVYGPADFFTIVLVPVVVAAVLRVNNLSAEKIAFAVGCASGPRWV